MKSMLAWVTCLVFWALASMLSGAKEPWDAASFWCCIYPAALALSAVLGALFQRASWAAGAMVMFAQLPVTLVSAEASPLLAAGVIYVAILAIPAMMVSWCAGGIRRRRGGG